MILSDKDIKALIKKKKLIFIPPLSPEQIGPASIDLRLGDVFKTFNISKYSILDPKKGFPEKDIIITQNSNFQNFSV